MRYRDVRKIVAGSGSSSNQIYNILCFVSLFFGVFAALQSWVAGLSPYLVAANAVFSLLFGLLYVISRLFGRARGSLIVGPAFLIFVFIPAIWIFNGGTSSGTAYIVILFDSFIVVLATGDEARVRERLLAAASMCLLIVSVCFLLWLEFTHPELMYRYPDQTVRFVDTAVSMIIAVVGNFLILRTYVSQHHRDFARIQRYSETLEVLVQTDAMTGFLNHAHGIRRLETEVAKARRYKRPLSILMCDLDFFKKINDDFGHQAGDEVIMRFSECLRNCARVSDVLIRYGGEEFIVILTETNLASAACAGERLRSCMRSSMSGPPRPVTVSGGIAECLECDTADSMIKRADGLLYLAKRQGRDRILSSNSCDQ